MKPVRKLLRQDSSGGGSFSDKLRAISAEKTEEMKKKEKEIKESGAHMPESFTRELTKQLVLEAKEKEGFFVTPTLDTKITLMVREKNPEEALKIAADVNKHLEWQKGIINRLGKQPKGKEILLNLRMMAMKAPPEKVYDLLKAVEKRLEQTEQQ